MLQLWGSKNTHTCLFYASFLQVLWEFVEWQDRKDKATEFYSHWFNELFVFYGDVVLNWRSAETAREREDKVNVTRREGWGVSLQESSDSWRLLFIRSAPPGRKQSCHLHLGSSRWAPSLFLKQPVLLYLPNESPRPRSVAAGGSEPWWWPPTSCWGVTAFHHQRSRVC